MIGSVTGRNTYLNKAKAHAHKAFNALCILVKASCQTYRAVSLHQTPAKTKASVCSLTPEQLLPDLPAADSYAV